MNVFADDWRDCLREQFMHVVRSGDDITLPSLTRVMHDVGFTDEELAELRVRATMHVDDVDEDFVPDMDVLEPTVHAGVEVPAEAVEVEDPQTDLPPTYEEALEESEAVDEDDTLPDEDDEDDPLSPQQLSLF
ncbi:MAG: hypothetical protein K8L99_08060 [Anaerolineae bacterium]|nr:hypothetical protein [Anaerolineae bacterium]